MTEAQNTKRPGALIAMSGGVDSSVAAWLMQQAGYDCTGITMRLTRNETLGQSGFHTCCSEKDIEDAAEVAFAMDIPYEVLDFTADFREKIIEKFIRVYEMGGTPNPCIDCNRYMKFDHLLRWAESHGMEYVVTGHYARVEQDEATGRWLLKKGLDEGKDQSYVLYNLTQEQLAHVRLPLGGLHKAEVREIAEKQHFINARKHDSQDICFVPDGDYARFMEDFTGKHYPAGDFLDENGKKVGTHNGAVRYTIGQRKGLGLAMGAPVYVCAKDMQANTVTVGPEENLFDRIVYADEVNWIAIPELTAPLRVTARTRYHQTDQAATVYPAELVKSKFMKLDGEHIRFVLDCMRENTTKIRNIKQYLKAALFNAPSTIGNYYTSLVAHDMASGALSPKKPQYGDPDYYSCNEGESL